MFLTLCYWWNRLVRHLNQCVAKRTTTGSSCLLILKDSDSDSLDPFWNHQLESLELHSMSTIRFAWSISKPSTRILWTSFYVNHQIRLVHFEAINWNPWNFFNVNHQICLVHFETINWKPCNFIQCQPSDLLGPFRNHQLETL